MRMGVLAKHVEEEGGADRKNHLYIISTALAVLFTLVDSGIDRCSTTTGDSFDCSKLLNGVEPITQTNPD